MNVIFNPSDGSQVVNLSIENVKGINMSYEKCMEWYGVRSVYHFGVNSKGINVFEERVVVFQARSFEEAHQKAELEAMDYAKDCDFELHPEQVAYKQDGNSLIDNYEVWSELFEANLSLNDFYKERYEKYTYHPENA